MSNIPNDLKYSKEHEWVRVEGNRAVIGITDYAQHKLGAIVFVDLPGVGQEYGLGDTMLVVESVKAVSDVYAPISGKVAEVNEETADAPQIVNEDPYGKGWLVVLEITDPAELDNMLDAEAYAKLTLEE